MEHEDDRYGKITRAMCKDQRITHVDRTVYAYIKTYINWRVVQTEIARELDMSISTVQRSINRLDAAGYLTYDTKATEQKKVRTNIKMLDKPATTFKNEHSKMNRYGASPLDHHVQICIPPYSNLNVPLFKNECPEHSKMNSYKASAKASLTAASLTAAADEPAKVKLARRLLSEHNSSGCYSDEDVEDAKLVLAAFNRGELA